jgi:gingipain R
MKSCILVLLSVVLFSPKIFAEDIFIKAGSKANGENENTKINLISSDNSKTVIEIQLNGFYNKREDINGAGYDNIYLKDFVSLGNPGQAALPTITKMIAIPNYKGVRVVINNSSYQTFESYDVIPYQTPPLRNTNGISNAFEKDSLYYSANKNYPENIVSIKEIAVLRDYRVAVVTINPVQYNPALRQLRVYTEINFELKYEGNSNVNNLKYRTQGISRSFENIYKQVIFNYSNDNTLSAAPNMLIITADSLYNSILPYSEWKIKKGIKTVIKKRSELGLFGDATAQQIKDYIITQYNSPDRPEYVLLVGDASGNNTIPWFDAIGGKSDHPYECVEGTDILPDIVVGRISVQTTGELDSSLAKFIQYEESPNMQQTDWYKRAFILHSNDGIDPINGQVARNVFLDEGGFTNVDVVNPSATQTQITNFINGGVSWIWFIGHGNETSWATPIWNMSNMVNLNFGMRQPNIVSIACSNADLDYSQTADCFGEAWVKRSPQNSSTNIAAATELCAFYTTDTLGREMLYAYFRHGIFDFGSMLNYGKIQAYNYFNGNSTVVETIDQFMVLGDPTIESYSDIPKYLNVISSLNGDEYKINVKSNGVNVEGALVAVNQNNTLKISGYTDNSGDYVFHSSDIENGVTANLVVTGKNLYPYDGNMILTSVAGNQEIPNSFSLSQNYPNPFNPVTHLEFGISNLGFVTLKVYDILGNEVKTLVNESKPAGKYEVEFDGSNFSSGIYFYKLTAGDFSEVKKMTLLK